MREIKFRVCKECGVKFSGHPLQLYCTDRHRKTARNRRKRFTPGRIAYLKRPDVIKRHAEVAKKSYWNIKNKII